MYVTVVYVSVIPEKIGDFIDATHANHEASVQEPGNLRFDVLQSDDDPSAFILYEAYRSQDDAAAHKHTSHYLTWRETVGDWMTEARQGVRYNGLCPVIND